MMREKNNPQLPEGDDGRTIANMYVDGMPWYDSRMDQSGEAAPQRAQTRMSRSEERMYIWAAIKSALLIGAVFISAFGAFLLFCSKVWFH